MSEHLSQEGKKERRERNISICKGKKRFVKRGCGNKFNKCIAIARMMFYYEMQIQVHQTLKKMIIVAPLLEQLKSGDWLTNLLL
jgi:hypothetical protein